MIHDLEAEQSAIACVLLDNDCLEVFTRLKPSHFYAPANRLIYEAICYLANKNVAVDLVTLSERLKATGKLETVGGNEYLTNLMDLIPSTANFRHYVAILRKDEMMRSLDRAAAQITKSLNQPDAKQKPFEDGHAALQYAEKLIFDISKEEERQELTKISKELPTVMNNLDLVAHNPKALKGISTGFTVLDSVTNGLQKGSLIIIGARPSVGKSSLAMNIVLNAALNEKQKTKVAVFSMEMSKTELTNRAICSVARVSLSRAAHGELTPEEWTRLWDANAKLQKADIYLDDSAGITAAEIMRKCMRLKRERGLDLVMIDYLGLMAAPNGNGRESRQEQVAANSRMMKMMAKELEIPVLLLSQLNRRIDRTEKNENDEPVLSDLRESGAIEQDADIVMFIHKPKTETQSEQGEHNRDYEAKIIIAKNRSGPTPYFKLQFIGALTTFMNPEDVNKTNGVASVPVPVTKVSTEVTDSMLKVTPLVNPTDVSDVW